MIHRNKSQHTHQRTKDPGGLRGIRLMKTIIKYVTNPAVLMVIMSIFIVLGQLGHRKEIRETKYKYESIIRMKDSAYAMDSTYIESIKITRDSLFNVVKTYKSNESSSSVINKGTVVITETTTKQDTQGNIITTTKKTEIDTSKIVSVFVKNVIDSMSAVTQFKLDSLAEKFVAVKETVTVYEKDSNVSIEYVEKIVIKDGRPRFQLQAGAYVERGISSSLNPVLNADIHYNVISPLFLHAGIKKDGNLFNWGIKENYNANIGIGVKIPIF